MKNLMNETLRVNEEFENGQGVEPGQEVSDKVPVTDDLVQQLSVDVPGLADADREEVMKGLEIEQEHMAAIGGDIVIVAKLVMDHINEFPGKKYYAALEAMEAELQEEEVAPEASAEGGETGEVATPKVEDPMGPAKV